MLAAAIAVGVALGVAARPADASEIVGRNATNVRLDVDSSGRAWVRWRTADGSLKTVVASGAINARHPSRTTPQVKFTFRYSSSGRRRIGPNVCGPYRGPRLPWFVLACTHPNGSHWALQAWQRALPNYGVPPTPVRAVRELRLSHWSGPIAVLTIKTDWAYRGRFDHLWGTFRYRGRGVYGFRSDDLGVPLDTYGRNIYVDTLDSSYGPGWKRENSFLTHRPTGGFCYGFYPHRGAPGKGRRYRATVIGPSVTPDIFWEGPAPGPYDPVKDQQANEEQRRVLGDDPQCVIN